VEEQPTVVKLKRRASGESRGDDAVLEGEGRKAHGVIFEIENFSSPNARRFARGDQRRAANGVLDL